MMKYTLLVRRPIGLLLIGTFLSVSAVPLQMDSETKMARREDYGPSPAELLARLLADRDGFTDNPSPLEENSGQQAASDSFSSVFPSSFSFGHGSIPSRRTSFWKNGELRNFESDQLSRFAKRNIDEIDRTAFDSFFKRNFDEIDRVGPRWTGFLNRLYYRPQNPRHV